MGESPYVADFVFPIVALSIEPGGTSTFKGLLGTGFLIGKRGFALTAGHVLPEKAKVPEGETVPEGDAIVAALFISEGKWKALPVSAIHQHPSEDVCLLQMKLKGRSWASRFRLHTAWEGGWGDYWMCGYPENVLYEDRRSVAADGTLLAHPDLIHAKGNIRRRVTADLGNMHIRGTDFFELSTVVGDGCSGGPVFKPPVPHGPWEVMGIYVGKTDNESHDLITKLGVAARAETFATWAPRALGKTLEEEAQDWTR